MLEAFAAWQGHLAALQTRHVRLPKSRVAVVGNASRQILLAQTQLATADADCLSQRALHLRFVHLLLLATGAGRF